MNYQQLENKLNPNGEDNITVTLFYFGDSPDAIQFDAKDTPFAIISNARKVKLFNLDYKDVLDNVSSDDFNAIIQFARDNSFKEMADVHEPVSISKQEAKIIYDALQWYFMDYRVIHNHLITKSEADAINGIRNRIGHKFNLVNHDEDDFDED